MKCTSFSKGSLSRALSLLCCMALLCLSLGCAWDAEVGKLQALGDPAKVECWSGGKLIYSGHSTGKVESEASSDGYFFRDAETSKLMEVSGNCVITYGTGG